MGDFEPPKIKTMLGFSFRLSVMVYISGPTADVTLFTGFALLLPHSERPLVIKKRNKQNRILMTSVVPLLLWLYGPQKYLETLMVL